MCVGVLFIRPCLSLLLSLVMRPHEYGTEAEEAFFSHEPVRRRRRPDYCAQGSKGASETC